MAWVRGGGFLIPVLCLTACNQSSEVVVEPPLPKLPASQSGPGGPAAGPSLEPLATPQQVVRAVDVGRPDPFAAVLKPRLMRSSTPQVPVRTSTTAVSLAPPKGLVLQGVLQGRLGMEALVEYSPSESKGSDVRSGSLHVGDVGTVQEDSLLPPGWKVRAIDVAKGILVLQSGNQSVKLAL